jgi:hypothetical protein
MTDIDEILRSDAARWLAAQPAPPSLDAISSAATRPRGRGRVWFAVAATVLVVAAIALVPLLRSASHHASTTPIAASPQHDSAVLALDQTTFVAVHAGPPATVQLRSLSNGQLVKNLYVTAKDVTAAYALRAPDGSIVVTSGTLTGCSTRVERVDPVTGLATGVRTVAESMRYAALSPDGTKLAYLTWTSCAAQTTPPSVPAGLDQPSQSDPNVLTVLDLRTGSAVRTTISPGALGIAGANFGLSWSPDGRRIVAAGLAGTPAALLFDAAGPQLAGATRVPAPPGCSYSAPAWTTSGIIVAQTCGGVSPQKLVEISAAGVVGTAWPLPGCIDDGVLAATDPQHTRAVVQLDLGDYGPSCSASWATRIVRIDGATLTTVLTQPLGYAKFSSWAVTSG